MYSRFSLPELTAHLISMLEHRRGAFERFDAEAEASLTTAVADAMKTAQVGFAELADDNAYWARTEQTLMTVVLPRYLKLAKQQHALEQTAYGAWRRGDLFSRVAYAAIGLFSGVIIARTAIPDWLEPISIALFLGGPLLPDFQAWWARRQYAKACERIVDDMANEQAAAREYQPLGIAPVGSDDSTVPSERTRE